MNGLANLGERLAYAVLWGALLAFALRLAPPADAATLGQILALLRADMARVDALTIAIFNLLGVLPGAFLALVLFDGGRPRPLPFALGAFVLGGFVLLPYLILRDTRAPLRSSPPLAVRAIGSRAAGWLLALAAAGLLGFGLLAGHPLHYLEQARGSLFIATMSADLLALTAALHLAAAADRRRRDLRLAANAAGLVRLPLLGPLLYLALRPPLAGSATATSPVLSL